MGANAGHENALTILKIVEMIFLLCIKYAHVVKLKPRSMPSTLGA